MFTRITVMVLGLAATLTLGTASPAMAQASLTPQKGGGGIAATAPLEEPGMDNQNDPCEGGVNFIRLVFDRYGVTEGQVDCIRNKAGEVIDLQQGFAIGALSERQVRVVKPAKRRFGSPLRVRQHVLIVTMIPMVEGLVLSKPVITYSQRGVKYTASVTGDEQSGWRIRIAAPVEPYVEVTASGIWVPFE